MPRPSLFQPAMLFALMLPALLPAVVHAQTSTTTESLPPIAVQAPKPPVAPSLPKAGLSDPATDLRQPTAPMAGGGHAAHNEADLLRNLLGSQAASRPAIPTQPGNDVFGAIQEVLAILEADPKTDWGRVNLDALRAHLIDMNEVMLNAEAKVEAVAGGIRVTVSGKGRTLAAIQRMVPDQARMLDGHDGWHVMAEDKPDSVILTVTAKDARQTAKIRGLGFSGVMATGSHHQMHHLAIARGEAMPHMPVPHPASPLQKSK